MSFSVVRTSEARRTSPVEFFLAPYRHGKLIYRLVQRDVIGRYRGSFIGLAWSFFTPLIMLALYTFVFSVVFKARWEGFDTSTGYALVVFSGLIVHGILAECISRAPSLITSNPNYVKKMVFPLEVFAWVTVGSAMFHALVGWAVLTISQLALGMPVPWTAFLFPVVIMPLLLFMLGAVWFLSALSVYFRDIVQVTGMLSMLALFLAPIFYPLSSLPSEYRLLVYLNPLTHVLEQAREVLIYGTVPPLIAVGANYAAGLFLAIAGFLFFQRLRNGFADVV